MLVGEEQEQLTQKDHLEITIEPLMTFKELKLKTFLDYKIPIDLQRWLINDKHLNDDDNLFDCGITDESVGLNLYINNQSNQEDQQIKVKFKIINTVSETELLQNDINHSENSTNTIEIDINSEDDLLNQAAALPCPDTIIPELLRQQEIEFWKCPFCTFINKQLALACSVCGQEKPLSVFNMDFQQQEIIELENSSWKCSFCTFINPPLTLACSVCFHEKLLSGGEKFSISEELKNILNDENGIYNQLDVNNIVDGIINPTAEENLTVTSSVIPTEPAIPTMCHYIQILTLDTINIVQNTVSFDCPICFINVEADEGCVLRDCLHTFCRDCLASTIQYSEDVEIKCPYANGDYNCDSFLQEREIRSLVTQEIYDKHLAKSVRYAEHQIQNAFHCKTPNCQGWCIYEDNVNEFQCPVCEFKNCLKCKVIHNGLTCTEYQDELNRKGQVKLEVQRTNEMIDEMVNNGKFMKCPTCKVILEKMSGCDWLRCFFCKTEVCWATRKPRRGPNGCNCGVAGKCHPNCNNCH